MADELSIDEYAEQIHDMLVSLYEMPCGFQLDVQARVKGYSDDPDKIHDITIFWALKSQMLNGMPDLDSIKSIIESDIIMNTAFD